MRITQNLMFDSIRFYANRNSRRLLEAQERVATQKRINRISDDPVAAPRLLSIRSELSKIDQFVRNIERADSLADVYDTTLGQADELLSRVKELMLGEANQVTSTPETREAAEREIASIVAQFVQLGNTRFDDKYIFAGFATDAQPFTSISTSSQSGVINTGTGTVSQIQFSDPTAVQAHSYSITFLTPTSYNVVDTTTGQTVVPDATFTPGESITFDGLDIAISGAPAAFDAFTLTVSPPGDYLGDNGQQTIEVQSGTQVQQNLTGDRVFKGTGVAGGVDVFGVLNSAITALRTNDRAALDTALDNLDLGRTQVDSERAIVGSRQRLLGNLLDRHGEVKIGLQILQSEIEDIDLTEAITELTQRQNTLEATLAAAGRISSISLLDFLR